MAKTIKNVMLGILTMGMLVACNANKSNSTQNSIENSQSSTVSTSESASASSKNSSISSSPSSSSSISVANIDIELTAAKLDADVNEEVTITSNVDGVILRVNSTNATVANGVFKASKAGKYTIIGHKDGNYNDGMVTINVTFKSTIDKVKNVLKEVKAKKNYSINVLNDFGGYEIYRTENYYFDSLSKQGQGLFKNIIPGTTYEKVAHFIKLNNNNELIIGNDVIYKNAKGDAVVATDLDDVDNILNIDLDKAVFEENKGKFYTGDDELFYFISGILGSQIVLYGSYLEFDFDNNYNLSVKVIFIDETSGEILDEMVDGIGVLTFHNIGTTEAPVIDDKYKAITIGNETMSKEVASSFMSTKGHIKTTINLVDLEGNVLTTAGVSEYNFDENYVIDDKNVRGTLTHNFYEKDSEGNAVSVGITPDNKVSKNATKEWSSFTFPFSSLDTSEFRLTGENTYSYLGTSSHAFACDLAWGSIEKQIAYVTAHIENGKVASFTCETENLYGTLATNQGNVEGFFKYVFEVEVLPYETIVAPTPYEADANTTRVAAYLDEITGPEANYTMYVGDHANTSNYKIIKVTKDTILVQEFKNKESSYYGYHRLSDGVIAFSATNNNGVAKAKLEKDVEVKQGEGLASLLGFSAVPEVLTFNEDNNIVFKNDVINAGTSLFNEFYYPRTANDRSIEFVIGAGHIATINYQYGSTSSESAFASFYTASYSTTTLSSEFEINLLSVLKDIRGAKTPTTWKEESNDIYTKLTAFLDNRTDLADVIPYVYDQTYSGNFKYLSNTTTLFRIECSKTMSDAYRASVIDRGVELGGTKSTNGKTVIWTLENGKKITVGTTGSQISVMYKA